MYQYQEAFKNKTMSNCVPMCFKNSVLDHQVKEKKRKIHLSTACWREIVIIKMEKQDHQTLTVNTQNFRNVVQLVPGGQIFLGSYLYFLSPSPSLSASPLPDATPPSPLS